MARVLVPLAQGCEELEAATITDLLSRAGVEVVTAGLDDQPVKAARGLTLLPDTTLDAVVDESFDMIVLPGGLPGADYLDQDPRIHRLLQRLAGEGGYTAAICAAPKVLASAGLLEGRSATSYPGVLDGMDLPGVDVDLRPVITDGKVITSRGPGTAMDFSLALIEALEGKAKRDEVEAGLVR
ncbi:MAG: DJ-1/PfpI family protein [gamma proteobacterium endosymbiont of Lamellibrachia anaximandri]|nr:DJ-1/PfpI family protein [gamma proteobacterium endosymbiont of Lamellibrachia anaximandri]